MKSDDGKQRVLSLSYGKDSIATIRACELLGLPLDRIVTADVWATENIPADLPPMWAFKQRADKIIFERWGIRVEHLHATRGGYWTPTSGTSTENDAPEITSEALSDSRCRATRGATNLKPRKLTYEAIFYSHLRCNEKRVPETGKAIYGFPIIRGNWCNAMLKRAPQQAPPRGREKYRGAVSRHCSGRAYPYCTTHQQARYRPATCRNRMGRGVVRLGSQIYGAVVTDL